MEARTTARRQRSQFQQQPRHDSRLVRKSGRIDLVESTANQGSGSIETKAVVGPAGCGRSVASSFSRCHPTPFFSGHVDFHHRETAAAGDEDQHEIHGVRPPPGRGQAQCSHDAAPGQGHDHIGISGQRLAEKRQTGEERRLQRRNLEQHGNHGVPAGHQTVVGQLPEHAVEEDQEGGEERNGERDGREVLVVVPVAVQCWGRRVDVSGLDVESSRRGDRPRQSGTPRVGDGHVGQRVQRRRQNTVHSAGQGTMRNQNKKGTSTWL